MLKKLLCGGVGIFLLAMSNLSFAETHIALGGGVIDRGSELAVSLDKLKPGLAYLIHCGIIASGDSKMTFDVMGAANEKIYANLNSVSITSNLEQSVEGLVHAGDNSFTFWGFTRASQGTAYIYFQNLNGSETQTVHDCFAHVL